MTSSRVSIEDSEPTVSEDSAGRIGLREKQISLATAVVGLLAAVAGGVFGLVQMSGKDDARETVASLQDQVDRQDRTIGRLNSDLRAARQGRAEANADNEKLQASNAEQAERLEDLTAQLQATDADATTGKGPVSGPDDPEIERKGVVKLEKDQSISLDLTANYPWSSTLLANDLLYVGGGALNVQNLQLARMGSRPATYSACASLDSFDARSTLPLEELPPESYLCARVTSSDRIAALKVVTVDPPRTITFDITTWATG